LKRTFAAAVAALTASTSMGLTATMAASAAQAEAAAPAATLRVVPGWTYRDGGKLAVIAGCSQRGDVRVISSKLLPRPVRMSRGSLLIKVTGRETVRIYMVLGAFQQPDQPALPSAFKPDVTVSSGQPAATHPKPGQKGR